MSDTEQNHQQAKTTPRLYGRAETAGSRQQTEYNLCHSQLQVMENSVFKDPSILWCDAVVRRVVADVSKHDSASILRVNLGWSPTWCTKFLFIYLQIIHLLKSSTCFEHYPAHLQEVYVVIVYMQPLVSSFSAGAPVLNRRTRQSPAESDDTRGCIYIQLRSRPPQDEQRNARNM